MVNRRIVMSIASIMFLVMGLVVGCAPNDSEARAPSNETEGYLAAIGVLIPSDGIAGWESSETDFSFTRDDACIYVAGFSCKELDINQATGITSDEEALRVAEQCVAASEGSDTALDMTLVACEDIRFGFKHAKRIDVEYSAQDETSMKARILALQYGSDYTFLVLTAPAETFDSYTADFDAFVDSVQITQ